jgi:hypothetical protein
MHPSLADRLSFFSWPHQLVDQVQFAGSAFRNVLATQVSKTPRTHNRFHWPALCVISSPLACISSLVGLATCADAPK